MTLQGRSPSRISLFGSGTDLPGYAKEHGGLVLSIAIDLLQRMTWRDDGVPNQLPVGGDPKFYSAFGFKSGLEASYEGIINGGLGSSAAAAVLMVGLKNPTASPTEIAERAWEIETKELKLFGGKQDQYAAAYGGVNIFSFSDKVEILPLKADFIEPLLPSLVLFYTGTTRRSPRIQEGLRSPNSEQIKVLHKIHDLVEEGAKAIAAKDIERAGSILDYSWELKKQSNQGITTPKIDQIYTKAKKHGAWGGKVCGAGGGGYMFFVVDPVKRESFIETMSPELTHQDFNVDWEGLTIYADESSNSGSRTGREAPTANGHLTKTLS